jgi:hypothetical protein
VTSWTISTGLIKIYNFANYGLWFADYLWVYKIFILFEWIIPAIYIWLASDLVEKLPKSPKRKRPVRVIEVVEEVEFEEDIQRDPRENPLG